MIYTALCCTKFSGSTYLHECYQNYHYTNVLLPDAPLVQWTSEFTPLVSKLSLIQSHLLWGEFSI